MRSIRHTASLAGLWLLLSLLPAIPCGHLIASEFIDFDTQIMAILSTCGCNAAACHGSSGGRGGFQLSLFGSDPDLDYDQIVREGLGRRIHRTMPEESLLLLKATDSIAHGGGLRLDSESREYQLILDWIAEGAKRIRARRLLRIEIDPPFLGLKTAGDSGSFRILARFDDGNSADVSADAVISLLDETSLQLDGTRITARRPGQHSVTIRYLDQVALMQVTLPYSDKSKGDLPSRGFIDDAINARLNHLGIGSLPVADDLTLYRRLSLDLKGELPEFAEAEAFARSVQANKYERLVDRMLADQQFADLWSWHLAEWLRVGGAGQGESVAGSYHQWIRERVADDASLARIARETLTATGGIENGATGFYRLTTDPGIQAELACNTWMGVRIGCANCHDHPLDHWKRNGYFQFAAFFAGIRRNEEIRVTADTTLINPVTRKPALATLPGGVPVDDGDDPRDDFADWMLSSDNPYFAHSTANRIWAILMGRGIFEPVDDFRITNPLSNRELLDGLAQFHRENDFELRPLIREIVLSEAYRRRTSGDAATEKDRFFWRFLPRELPPPVRMGAVECVCGISEPNQAHRWLRLSQPWQSSELLALGQCGRETNCLPSSSSGGSEVSLARNIELINGPLLNDRIGGQNGFLTLAMAQSQSDREILESLYARAYGRMPVAAENKFWLRKFAGIDHPDDRKQLWHDIVWAILNSREFLTNR